MKKQDCFLEHFGIKGMRWGVRRYQNEDRTLTEEGKRRYGSGNKTSDREYSHRLNKIDRESSISKSRAETLRGYVNDRKIRVWQKRKSLSERSLRMIAKWESEAAAYEKLSKEGSDFIDKLGKQAIDSKKSIKMRDVWRYSGPDYGREKYVPGHRYKVRSDDRGSLEYRRTINPNVRRYVTRYYY